MDDLDSDCDFRLPSPSLPLYILYITLQLIQYTAHMFTSVKEQDMFYLSTDRVHIYIYT